MYYVKYILGHVFLEVIKSKESKPITGGNLIQLQT